MAAPYTGTAEFSNLIRTAYDRKTKLALRTIPCFRSIADTKPVAQTQPGSSVVFSIHRDLAPATVPLDGTNDYTDPTGVTLNDVQQTSVMLHEYGNFTVTTNALEKFNLDNALTSNVSNLIAYNLADSIDRVVESTLQGIGNTAREIGGSVSKTGAITGITSSDTFKSRDVRLVVAELRTASVAPTDGANYVAYVHPQVSLDLRQETGPAGWRTPQEYGAGDGLSGIFAGEIGLYEGCRFVETPRGLNSQRGSGTGAAQTRVFNTYVFGREALAEAVAQEFGVVIDGVIVDPLNRRKAIGWYGIAGWSLFRPESAWQIQTASSVRPTT